MNSYSGYTAAGRVHPTVDTSLSSRQQVNEVVKVDPSGLVEFPLPGDTKKHLLPYYIDPEELGQLKEISSSADTAHNSQHHMSANGQEVETFAISEKDLWMPDKLCKVCYGCEDPFTMYRRRHHCRMCGQVFCNPCCSYYIDGTLINLQGLVRSCRLCNEQLSERIERENKQFRKKMFDLSTSDLESNSTSEQSRLSTEKNSSSASNKASNIVNNHNISNTISTIKTHKGDSNLLISLQMKASNHLENVVSLLVKNEPSIINSDVWKRLIVHLVREVVSSVDPNVKHGDNIDIRSYVKLKIIPGGDISDSTYIDGIVFRKNVSHKKMISKEKKIKPRILLLSGGIDFQRTDARLSSMDTLIEQEDKYIEILVEKVLSLKPDIILVGKSVARKAQELLICQNVVVLQNVKYSILDRIRRLTGATMLPSTDHMIQQNGDECVGTCGSFSLKQIQNEFNKAKDVVRANRILTNRPTKGSMYVYLQGCPSALGCTIILRGGSKAMLSKIKKIISFSIVIAYHLRLEVAYYNDRSAILPNNSDDDVGEVFSHSISEAESFEKSRKLLSSSMDIDFGLPYSGEIRGGHHEFVPVSTKLAPQDHQTLLVTSILMADGSSQKSKAEIKAIRFYTAQDIALGQFLMESCFNTHKQPISGNSLIDHTLSFVHKTGRIDISVHRVGETFNSTSFNNVDDGMYNIRDPFHMPIYMSSYCKVCDQIVAHETLMSDETWKMSFGKFMEIIFYNTTACVQMNGCSHCLRDSHILFFSCEGYAARFEFSPIFPFSIHIRPAAPFPFPYHHNLSLKLIADFPYMFGSAIEMFQKLASNLKIVAKDILNRNDHDRNMVLADISALEQELVDTLKDFTINISTIYDKLAKMNSNAKSGAISLPSSMVAVAEAILDESHITSISGDYNKAAHALSVPTPIAICNAEILETKDNDDFNNIAVRYPMCYKRQAFANATAWNKKFSTIIKYLEHEKLSLPSLNFYNNVTLLAILQSNDLGVFNEADLDDGDADYDEFYDKHTELVVDNSPSSTSNDHQSDDFSNSTISSKAGSSLKSVETADKTSSAGDNKQMQSDLSRSNILSSATPSTANKPNRITKAFTRFMMGKDPSEKHYPNKGFLINLGSLGEGRLGLPIGRKGQVVAISEDEPSTIIAYTLASSDYYEKVQNDDVLQEYDFNDVQTFKHDEDNVENNVQTKLTGNTDANESTKTVLNLNIEPTGENEKNNNIDDDMTGNAFYVNSLNSDSTNIYNNNNGHDLSNQDMNANFHDKSPKGIDVSKSIPPVVQTETGGKANVDFTVLKSKIISQRKSQIRHQFVDYDVKNDVSCKFVCDIHWATQFEALRAVYLQDDENDGFIRSLSISNSWIAQGGKSGAKFSKTADDRFIIKVISKVELQMFLEFAPAYFDYMAKVLFEDLYFTVLCKILGVYTIGYHNKETNKKVLENVVVMENIFYQRNISRVFDLKGSSRARYVDLAGEKVETFDELFFKISQKLENETGKRPTHSQVLLDDNLVELTGGRPFPLKHRAKVFFHKAILNDTSFLEIINVVDYSILIGFDEDSHEIVVGIIDYMRQYDFIKRMERMGKSVGMLAGQQEPTIIQPPHYRKRFNLAMDRYFMTVPDKHLMYDI